MKDVDKTKEQLATDVAHLRQRVAELEAKEDERKQAEETLRESEEKYRSVVERANDGIGIAQNAILHYVNPRLAQITGYSVEELIGLPFSDFFIPEEVPKVVDHYKRRMAGKDVTSIYESALRHKNGSRIEVELNAGTISYKGKPADLVMVRDITERKLAEETLKFTRFSLDNAVDTMVCVGHDGRFIDVNDAFCRSSGYSREELFSMTVHDIDPDYSAEIWPEFWEKLKQSGSLTFESCHRTKEGKVFPVEITANFLEYKGKEYHCSFARDITERKRMEGALQESEGKYRSLVESSKDSIYLVDSDCRYLFINAQHFSRLGLKNRQVIGKGYGEFHSPEETKDFAQKVEKILKTGKSLSYEYRSQRDNRYFIRTLSPVKVSKEDKPSAITVISKDITELKQAEDTLREREAFNFALFHYNPAETIVVDLEGKVTGFNLAKEKSGDRLPAIGDAMYKDYAGKHEIDMRAELMKCIRSGKTKGFPQRKYGDKYLSITIAPFSKGALIISDDVTERKLAEELLQKERDTFFSVLQNAPYGVVFLDKDGKCIFSNAKFTDITGYTLDDVPTIRDWERLAYPDKKYRDIVIKTWSRDFVPSVANKIFRETFHKAFFWTFSVACKDGAVKELEFRPTVLEDGSTVVMLADITERKRMHELLETAATEWRATFDAINDSVCLLDLEGRVKRCNNAMLKIIVKPFSEIADRRSWEILHGVSEPLEGCLIKRVQESRRRETEVLSRDNRWFNIAIDPLLNEEGNPIGFVHIMSDITKRIQIEEELKNSREQLRNLTAYLQSVREEERTRIAREIHDELAQALTALRMDLSWLDKRLPRDQTPLIEKTKSMSNLINTIIQTVKRISAELRPGILDDLGLIAAIEWQAEEFQNRTGVACHVTMDQEDIDVDQDRSTAIFRIFQETLTNVARHARATRVTVGIKKRAGTLALMVRDNGKGITQKQISDHTSFGLIGMRERVLPWGGKVNIKGTSGKGTTVVVTLPVERE